MQAAGSLWKAEAKQGSRWESRAGSHWLRWGQVLSATENAEPAPSAVSGCLGVTGCTFRDLNQLAAHLVGALLCACLTLGLVVQVGRMAHTDCAIAQLRVMNAESRAALDRALTSREHVVSAVHLRLQALDSTLSMLAEKPGGMPAFGMGSNAGASPELQAAREELQRAHARELWRASDFHFIRRKLRELQDHGQKVLDELWRQSHKGKLKELQDKVADKLTEGDHQEMQDRFSRLFATLTKTVSRLEGHASGAAVLGPEDVEQLVGQLEFSMAGASSYIRWGCWQWMPLCEVEMDQVLGEHGGSPITHSEFQRLLHGLDPAAGGGSGSGFPAAGMQEDIGMLKAALGRQQAQHGYERLHIPDVAVSRGWRAQWDALVAQAAAAEQEGKEGVLEHAVQQCVKERRGERLLSRAALALVAVQAACAWVVWVATVQQAQHHHHD
ncbi:hypothetical protein ABPG75_004925 [Micractinium tetrahymenae]